MKEPLDIQRAVACIPHVTLQSVQLTAISAAIEEAYAGGELIPEVGRVRLAWTLEADAIHVSVPMAVRILQGEAICGTVMTTARLEYRTKPTRPGPEELRHYVGVHAFLHFWPYFRAEAQALTTKLGLPPLTLPVLLAGNATQFVDIGPPIAPPGRASQKVRSKPNASASTAGARTKQRR